MTTKTHRAGAMVRLLAATSFMAGVCAFSGTAYAAPVDFDPVVGTITGQDVHVTPFEVTESRSLKALLVDFGSPVPFDFLGLAIVDEDTSDQIPLFQLLQPGTLDFGIDPGRYLAVVGGIADGDNNIGTFGLEISNVPLPPAVWMFASSFIAMSFVRRRAR